MSYFLGTNKTSTEKPEKITVKEASFTNYIETPSTFSKRVHFPWTDGINKDIGIPSTVITPEISLFMMNEAFTEINNYVNAIKTITSKVKKVLLCLAPFFVNSEDHYKKIISEKTSRRNSLYQKIAEGTTSKKDGDKNVK